MSNVVFTTELVERIGLLGDVMASFLEEQVDAIQKRLSDKYPDAEEGAAWKTISKFATLEGTKIPMTKDEVQTQVEMPPKHIDFMLNLFDKARILRLADGIYEIAHDTLALQVSERRSGEEKALLEVKKLLTDRYAAYIQTAALLSRKEIDFVSPYKERLDMEEEQEEFYKKSKRNVTRRRAILIGALIAVFSIISLFAVYALIQQRVAIQEQKKAEIARIDAEKQREIAIEKEKEAIENARLAEIQRIAAVKAKAQAEAEKEKALIAKAEAERQEKIAEAEKVKAVKAKDEADAQRTIAEEQSDIAKAQTKIAKEKEAEALRQEAIAKEQEAIAKENERIAKRLRIRALSTALAIKSSEMKYQDRVKGLLAMEAFSLETSTDGTLAPPEIYTGLYSAINKFKGEGFDEIEDQHNGAIRGLVSDGKNKMITASSDGNISSWTFSNWKDIGKPKFAKKNLHSQRAVDLVANTSSDGKWVAVGGKKTAVDIINTENNNNKVAVLHQGKDVYDLAFSKDNKKLYSLGGDNTLQEYNMENGNVATKLVFLQRTERMAIHPNGKYIALGNRSGQLQIYDLNNLTVPIMNASLVKKITAISFDEHTESLVVGLGDGTVHLFKSNGGSYSTNNKPFRKNHGQQISDIKFNKYTDTNNNITNVMAIGSYDGTISVWMIDEFENELYEPLRLDNNQKWVTSLDFVDDGNHLVAGYSDGKIKFWSMNTKKLADKLCDILKAKYSITQLSDSEFKQYLGTGINRDDYTHYCK